MVRRLQFPKQNSRHNSSILFLSVFLFLSQFSLVLPQVSQAQEIRNNSLFGWEERTKHIIKDRYHNYGRIFYDRGLYRFTTPEMTREHELELISRDFTTLDDYNWFYNPENSFRGFAGSYNLGEFFHGATVRNYIQASESITIPLQFTRRYDLHSDRALIELGIDFNISGNHYAGIAHTLTEQKPDLDATFYYRFGGYTNGFVQIEFTPLDWANNASYELSRRRGDPFPELRDYKVKPYLFSIRGATPVINNFRGEIMGGVQTPQHSVTQGIEGLEVPFRDRELTRYLGFLLEYAIPYFTASVTWQHRLARFSRTNVEELPEVPTDYGNYQIHNSLGLFVSFNYNGFYIDNWIWRNYNRDTQFDKHKVRYYNVFQTYPFDFEENRVQMRNRVGYDPENRGFKMALEWSADYRNFLRGTVDHPDFGIVDAFDYRENYIRQISNRQERITLMIGYRFTDKIYSEIGASYDVDGDVYRGAFDQALNQNPSRFDGGFGRVVLYW